MHVCMSCYEVYDDFYSKHFEFCPKADCVGGEVVEVDELMIPAIIELNKRGYYTEFCCSGHIYDVSAGGYIKFAEGIEIETPPNGWEIESALMDNTTIIRYTFESEDKLDKYIEIMDSMQSLMCWALLLGECEEDIVMPTMEEWDKLVDIEMEIERYRALGAIEKVRMLNDCVFSDYKTGDIVEIFPIELAAVIDEDLRFADGEECVEDGIIGFMRIGDFECIQVYSDEVDLSWDGE